MQSYGRFRTASSATGRRAIRTTSHSLNNKKEAVWKPATRVDQRRQKKAVGMATDVDLTDLKERRTRNIPSISDNDQLEDIGIFDIAAPHHSPASSMTTEESAMTAGKTISGTFQGLQSPLSMALHGNRPLSLFESCRWSRGKLGE